MTDDGSRLVGAYLEGDLSPEQAANLERWLLASADNRRVFMREAFIHRRLFDAIRGQSTRDLLLAEYAGDELDERSLSAADERRRADSGPAEARRTAGEPNGGLICLTCEESTSDQGRRQAGANRDRKSGAGELVAPARPGRSRRVFSAFGVTVLRSYRDVQPRPTHGAVRRLLRGAPLAAAVALVLLLLIPIRSGSAPDSVPAAKPLPPVRVAEAMDVQWDPNVPAAIGPAGELGPGMLSLRQGLVKLRYASGAEVILEAPAKLQVISAMRSKLLVGRLAAVVPDSAHGFTVLTDNSTVTDLGTRFGVAINADGSSEAHVFEGKVALGASRAESGIPAAEMQVVGAGAARRVAAGTSPVVEAIEFNPLGFVRNAEFDAMVGARAGRAYARWLEFSYWVRRDPDVIVYYTFESVEGGGGASDRVWNVGGDGAYRLGHGRLHGGRPARGRFAEKPSIEFGRSADWIDLEAPAALETMTVAGWFYIDRLSSAMSTLMMSTRYGGAEGWLHWQVADDGAVVFHAGGVADLRKSGMLQRRDIGRWVHIASTYDARRGVVATYLDGELMARKSVEKAQAIEIGPARLGAWYPELLSREDPGARERPLRGRVDEFLLMRRALTASEVKRMYELGRPPAS